MEKGHEFFMRRCFELALAGSASASPNPLVGSVIVLDGKIIGEGFHYKAGLPHAEVNAIAAVDDKSLLKKATIYVNLEPCAHHGKTPPCANLIVSMGISRVVICNKDPFEQVSGKGIEILKEAGIEVITGILEEEGRFLNRRFFTSIEKQRPYVLLKWAKSKDSFMDISRKDGEKGSFMITGMDARRLVHQWRTEEDAILVGYNTVINDNPELNTRLVNGRNPIKVVVDPQGRIQPTYKIFLDNAPLIIISDIKYQTELNDIPQRVFVDLSIDSISAILNVLHKRNIRSVMVEGGGFTLQQFISSNVWDEIRLFTGQHHLVNGMPSPDLELIPTKSIQVGVDQLDYYYAAT